MIQTTLQARSLWTHPARAPAVGTGGRRPARSRTASALYRYDEAQVEKMPVDPNTAPDSNSGLENEEEPQVINPAQKAGLWCRTHKAKAVNCPMARTSTLTASGRSAKAPCESRSGSRRLRPYPIEVKAPHA